MKLPPEDVRYVDLPDVLETFVDSLGMTRCDGQSARFELCITRLDAINPPNKPTARKYPVCRLVMTPETLLELSSFLSNVAKQYFEQGILKKVEPPSMPGMN